MVLFMERMTRSILLAAFLGAILGVAVGYTPYIQPATAPEPQMPLMRQAAQPNVAFGTTHPPIEPTQLLIALLAALAVATPMFLVAKRRIS
jgi:hypothetical protein